MYSIFYNFFILPVLIDYYTEIINNLNYIKKNIKRSLKRDDKKDQFIQFSRERLTKESKISIEPEFLDDYISFKDDFLNKLSGSNDKIFDAYSIINVPSTLFLSLTYTLISHLVASSVLIKSNNGLLQL